MVNGVSVDIRPRSANKGAGASARSTAPAAADRINSAKVSLKDSVKLSKDILPKEYQTFNSARNKFGRDAFIGITLGTSLCVAAVFIFGPAALLVESSAIVAGVATLYLGYAGNKPYWNLAKDINKLPPQVQKDVIAQIFTVDPHAAATVATQLNH